MTVVNLARDLKHTRHFAPEVSNPGLRPSNAREAHADIMFYRAGLPPLMFGRGSSHL